MVIICIITYKYTKKNFYTRGNCGSEMAKVWNEHKNWFSGISSGILF